jgi:hypothetical protein
MVDAVSRENVEVVKDSLPDKPQFEGADGLRVLALLHQSGKPHGSDSAVHLHYGLLHTVEDGLVRRIEAYATPEEALTAAGLRAGRL